MFLNFWIFQPYVLIKKVLTKKEECKCTSNSNRFHFFLLTSYKIKYVVADDTHFERQSFCSCAQLESALEHYVHGREFELNTDFNQHYSNIRIFVCGFLEIVPVSPNLNLPRLHSTSFLYKDKCVWRLFISSVKLLICLLKVIH